MTDFNELQPEKLPVIVVEVDGGIVRDVFSNSPVNLIVLDYDVEGQEDVADIPQSRGGTKRGYFIPIDPDVDPEFCQSILDLL